MTERVVTVVVHDVAPTTLPACRSLLAQIAGFADVPVTLLVAPFYHGAHPGTEFDRFLAAAVASGDELALHGLSHLDEGRPAGPIDHLRRRWYTAGEGEFSGLSESQAADRLARGRRWFTQRGYPLHGFVAPAWLMSSGTRRALAAGDFAYTATLSRLVALPSQAELASQSVVYSTRSSWRRALSLGWAKAVAQAQCAQPLLRLELHPADALYPAIRASWSRVLAGALEDRQALTVVQATNQLAQHFKKQMAAVGAS